MRDVFSRLPADRKKRAQLSPYIRCEIAVCFYIHYEQNNLNALSKTIILANLEEMRTIGH